MLVDPFGRRYREVVGGQIDNSLIIGHVRMYLDEIACAEDAEPQIVEAPGDLQCARAGCDRIV